MSWFTIEVAEVELVRDRNYGTKYLVQVGGFGPLLRCIIPL